MMINDHCAKASTLDMGPIIPAREQCEEPIRDILISAYKIATDMEQCLDAVGFAIFGNGEPSRMPDVPDGSLMQTALALREIMLSMNSQMHRMWDVIGHA
ncbi:MAG: hypothetical protein IKM73_07785 [Acidaminococcaceae bacterium]|nr:hypothetical protein [Acidaminococcaceae bacterium]